MSDRFRWQFDAPPDCPHSWIHIADEEDTEFAYRWILLDTDAPDLVPTAISER